MYRNDAYLLLDVPVCIDLDVVTLLKALLRDEVADVQQHHIDELNLWQPGELQRSALEVTIKV